MCHSNVSSMLSFSEFKLHSGELQQYNHNYTAHLQTPTTPLPTTGQLTPLYVSLGVSFMLCPLAVEQVISDVFYSQHPSVKQQYQLPETPKALCRTNCVVLPFAARMAHGSSYTVFSGKCRVFYAACLHRRRNVYTMPTLEISHQ